MNDTPDVDNDEHYARSASGIFDIRNVIAALLAVYGVILTIAGLAYDSTDKSGVGVNLWAGIGMIAVAIIFATWSLLRPVVPATDGPDEVG